MAGANLAEIFPKSVFRTGEHEKGRFANRPYRGWYLADDVADQHRVGRWAWNHMEFVVIDLLAQSKAIEFYLAPKRLTQETVMEWLRQFGAIIELPRGHQRYIFRSVTGPTAHFYFDHDGNLSVIKSGWLS